ncbi:MAG: aspartate-semialdehyde dehydrogenase [SAR86 cluster bacterium]|uniref:Aspartate-semialdehyde dehydrogenase n=1 Tax=SAR86 cluster bacterium TaxID=2030880 RepID=A0A520N2D2_9GAMM|nr:MAG: aspartate-semialdehyde dehydrogenase [SAR86 cluster bacterium]
MNSLINLALIGASGVVGKKIISLLENKNIEINNFYPLGSTSVGDEIVFNNNQYKIEDLTNFDYSKVNLAIFSAGSKVAEEHAKDFVNAGVYVIDLSSKFRYEKDIPLIIPEINGNEINLLDTPSLISNPNCSTSQLLMAIAPIHKEYEIDVLNIATYQAVSGTGKQAVQELKNQITDESINQEVYPKKIAFNVIPQCDIFLENDFTKEEMKLVWETKKILDKNIEVQATCVRVPVINGHSEAVFLRTKKETSREQIIELLKNSSGIKVIDNPKYLEYPTPLEHANDTQEVFVGRIRSQTINNENWISMWIVADNVYGKGAALNTVQILESLVENKKLC